MKFGSHFKVTTTESLEKKSELSELYCYLLLPRPPSALGVTSVKVPSKTPSPWWQGWRGRASRGAKRGSGRGDRIRDRAVRGGGADRAGWGRLRLAAHPVGEQEDEGVQRNRQQGGGQDQVVGLAAHGA